MEWHQRFFKKGLQDGVVSAGAKIKRERYTLEVHECATRDAIAQFFSMAMRAPHGEDHQLILLNARACVIKCSGVFWCIHESILR